MTYSELSKACSNERAYLSEMADYCANYLLPHDGGTGDDTDQDYFPGQFSSSTTPLLDLT